MQTRGKIILIVSLIIFMVVGFLMRSFGRTDLGTPAGLKKMTGYDLEKGRNIVDFEFDFQLFDSDAMWIVEGSAPLQTHGLEKLDYSKCESRSKGDDRDFIKGIVFSKHPNLSSQMGDFSVWRGGKDRNHYLMISDDGLRSAHWFFEG